jgi:homoprotocatechuate degradation regulator HpaR
MTSAVRKLPKYEQTISAALISAKEAVLSPMRPRLRENLITEPQWRVMRVLNDRGRTDATGIAEVALLHPPSVTRILKELEARGIVVRDIDPDDKRRAMAILTPEGRGLIRLIARDVRRVMSEYAERFGAERLERLLTELQALTAAIKGVE